MRKFNKILSVISLLLLCSCNVDVIKYNDTEADAHALIIKLPASMNSSSTYALEGGSSNENSVETLRIEFYNAIGTILWEQNYTRGTDFTLQQPGTVANPAGNAAHPYYDTDVVNLTLSDVPLTILNEAVQVRVFANANTSDYPTTVNTPLMEIPSTSITDEIPFVNGTSGKPIPMSGRSNINFASGVRLAEVELVRNYAKARISVVKDATCTPVSLIIDYANIKVQAVNVPNNAPYGHWLNSTETTNFSTIAGLTSKGISFIDYTQRSAALSKNPAVPAELAELQNGAVVDSCYLNPQNRTSADYTSGGYITTYQVTIPTIHTNGRIVTNTYSIKLKKDNTYDILPNYIYEINIAITGDGVDDVVVKLNVLPWDDVIENKKSLGNYHITNCYMIEPGATVCIPTAEVLRFYATEYPDSIPTSGAFTVEPLWTDIALLPDFQDHGKSKYEVVGDPLNDDNAYLRITPMPVEDVSTILYTDLSAWEEHTGNLIVAFKKDNRILWSYHIWVTLYNPSDNQLSLSTSDDNKETQNGRIYKRGDYIWMDRNLGADIETWAGTMPPKGAHTNGLLYNWGRKDPFWGTNPHTWNIYSNSYAAISNKYVYDFSGGLWISQDPDYVIYPLAMNEDNLMFSIRHPMTILAVNGTSDSWFSLSNDSRQMSLWATEDGRKSVFDPCPEGWRVPKAISANWEDPNTSWYVSQIEGWECTKTGYYPETAWRNKSEKELSAQWYSGAMHGNVNIWTSTITSTSDPTGASVMTNTYTGEGTSPMTIFATKNNSNQFSVRCVKEWN